jgi:hypothetical protein
VLRASSEFYDANPKYQSGAELLVRRALKIVKDDKIVRKALLEAQEIFSRGT